MTSASQSSFHQGKFGGPSRVLDGQECIQEFFKLDRTSEMAEDASPPC